MISISGLAHAASGPQAAGRSNPRCAPLLLWPPQHARNRRSDHRAKLARTVYPLRESCGMAPIAAIKQAPSAGRMAAFLRRFSRGEVHGDTPGRQGKARSDHGGPTVAGFETALSGSPTTLNAGRPGATGPGHRTARASIPQKLP